MAKRILDKDGNELRVPLGFLEADRVIETGGAGVISYTQGKPATGPRWTGPGIPAHQEPVGN